ncbi:MAG TPA: GIY-YIG nuclease family protein, partial [Terriglobales bacterium]|nr:GIY-YIG nuclease family protein [Terriglobales bacterium]
MDLVEKSRRLPALPGVYQFKNAEGTVIYVGKAKDLRARVRTYFLAGQWENAKTGSLLREAVDIETIVVDTEAEALALENTLIKQYQPRFNVLLRDDKTYPYIRLSQETYPRVYVTRRLLPDGSEYFGPYFPAGFAYRLVHFIHKHFLVPSCRVDLTRFHPRPCLQFHIRRCLGPCVEGLTTVERYQQAVRDTRLFLSGRQAELARELRRRRDAAAGEERFEEAAGYRDLLTVLEQAQDRQKMHAVEGEDADIVGFHREGARAALNLFHLRHGRVVDRREHFWEDLPDPPLAATAGRLTSGTRGAGALGPAPTKAQRSAGLGPGGPQVGVSTSGTRGAGALGPAPTEDWLGALLKQIYLGQPYLPPRISVPEEFEDRELLQAALARQRGGAVEIATPQRGAKKALLELAAKNAQLSFARRFRSAPADVQARDDWQALAAALGVELGAEPGRIECFDISHFQGAETVASMVVWEAGALRRGDYRKFRIRGVAGVDDFRSIQEVVRRRYQRRLADRGGRAALPAGKTGAKGCEIPQGGSPPGSEFGAAPAKRSAGLGPRGPQAGASTSGTRAAG